jgi:glucose-1-phosphate adenylyltransferase
MTHNDELAAKTIAVVLAGGQGARLHPLTRGVCKPALPFGGGLRSIDFALANCVNSGVRAVGVPTQYEPAALLAHLKAAWGPAALGTRAVVMPWRSEDSAPDLGYVGTADATYRNLDRFAEFDPSLVLVLGGDHIYRMDYRPMLERHHAERASVTIGCVPVPAHEARHFGVLSLRPDGHIDRFIEKPQTAADLPLGRDGHVLASMGIYVFDTGLLADILAADALDSSSSHDFGRDILPRLIDGGRAVAHPFIRADGDPGYWRDVGTLEAYWRAHMELLGPNPPFTIDDPDWPIGNAASRPRKVDRNTATAGGGDVEDSLVSDEHAIGGRVSRSVLSENVEIAHGAYVTDSVVLPGARIGPGCRLRGVIVDRAYRVPPGTRCEQDTLARGFAPFVLSADSLPHGAVRRDPLRTTPPPLRNSAAG